MTAEFGHIGFDSGGSFIDAWGAGPYLIEAGGKLWRFADSDRFGPALVNKIGDPLTNPYPSERSPFWRAHRIWVRQGRRVDDGIACVWEEPKPTVCRRLNKRDYLIVEHGEKDGATIVLDDIA